MQKVSNIKRLKNHLEDIYESIYTLPLWLLNLQHNEIRNIMLFSVKVLVKRSKPLLPRSPGGSRPFPIPNDKE